MTMDIPTDLTRVELIEFYNKNIDAIVDEIYISDIAYIKYFPLLRTLLDDLLYTDIIEYMWSNTGKTRWHVCKICDDTVTTSPGKYRPSKKSICKTIMHIVDHIVDDKNYDELQSIVTKFNELKPKLECYLFAIKDKYLIFDVRHRYTYRNSNLRNLIIKLLELCNCNDVMILANEYDAVRELTLAEFLEFFKARNEMIHVDDLHGKSNILFSSEQNRYTHLVRDRVFPYDEDIVVYSTSRLKDFKLLISPKVDINKKSHYNVLIESKTLDEFLSRLKALAVLT